jgi:hypothetical protein
VTDQDRPHPPLEPPDLTEPPPSPGSEAQAAELAALEAMLPPPVGEPAVAPDEPSGEPPR